MCKLISSGGRAKAGIIHCFSLNFTSTDTDSLSPSLKEFLCLNIKALHYEGFSGAPLNHFFAL